MPFDRTITKKSNGVNPLILVSNDDGYDSEGIQVLAQALRKIGRVVVVAPDRERSAASHALTLHTPLRLKNIGTDIYAVSGTPTDCINLGINGILKEMPNLIVSGINHGANLGDDVHYSGTVSAALEGGIMGVPAIAISLVGRKNLFFEAAAKYAVKLSKILIKQPLPKGIILNVNVPNLPMSQIKGYEFTIQGKRHYGNIIVEKTDPGGRKYFWIAGGEADFENIPNSDCNAIGADKISITPLRVDATDENSLKTLRKWKL
ncbi:MAG: 5'/3'-nucleotidase SurE [Pseudomonadota bacterium]